MKARSRGPGQALNARIPTGHTTYVLSMYKVRSKYVQYSTVWYHGMYGTSWRGGGLETDGPRVAIPLTTYVLSYSYRSFSSDRLEASAPSERPSERPSEPRRPPKASPVWPCLSRLTASLYPHTTAAHGADAVTTHQPPCTGLVCRFVMPARPKENKSVPSPVPKPLDMRSSQSRRFLGSWSSRRLVITCDDPPSWQR